MGARISKEDRETHIRKLCNRFGYNFLGWKNDYTDLRSKITLSNDITNNVWDTPLFNFINKPEDPSEQKINKVLLDKAKGDMVCHYISIVRVGCNLRKEMLFSFTCSKCLSHGIISSADIRLNRPKCKCGNTPRDKLYGVGVKDQTTECDYCPYYRKWGGILRRCYSDNLNDKNKFHSYKDCLVCEDWLLFSKFKSWCVGQEKLYQINIKDYEIDKDLKSLETKGYLYSPDLCTFVTQQVNCFMVDSSTKRGLYLLGAHRRNNGYISQCKDPFSRYEHGATKVKHLGVFDNEVDAHIRWAEEKYKQAAKLTECSVNNINNILGDSLVITYEKILNKARSLK
jgi:hypothetical protein